jgi:hypothetical protein
VAKKFVPQDQMAEAARELLANPTPSDGEGFDAGLHPEVIAAATAATPDIDHLAGLCAREGLAGRQVAELLILAVQAEQKYRGAPDRLKRAEQSLMEAASLLNALKRYTPKALDEVVPHAEAVDKATRDWTDALDKAAKAARHDAHVAYCRFAFPSLFGLVPERIHGQPVMLGTVPPELDEWFHQHDVDPDEFNAWQRMGVVADTRQRPVRKIVAVSARINQ